MDSLELLVSSYSEMLDSCSENSSNANSLRQVDLDYPRSTITGNPFGDGRSMDSERSRGDVAPSSEISYGKGRTRLNHMSMNNIEIIEDVTIYYKLTVDSGGNVVAFNFYKAKTTTADITLINRIGYAIKNQIKYNKVENAPLIYQDYTISVKAN